MNVEPKQILKKDSLILKKKGKSSRNEKKKEWEDLEGQENVRSKMKMTLGIKTKYKV